MPNSLDQIFEACERYVKLNRARSGCQNLHQRELLHIEMLKAVLDMQSRIGEARAGS
jgi:hypothetical protein